MAHRLNWESTEHTLLQHGDSVSKVENARNDLLAVGWQAARKMYEQC